MAENMFDGSITKFEQLNRALSPDEIAKTYEDNTYEKARDYDQIMRAATTRHSTVVHVEVIRVIEITSVLGLGVEESPVRQVTEHYTMDGVLIARSDPVVDAL